MTQNEKFKVVSLLTGVWGIGDSTAENLFSKGIKTIE